jgi:hypothetical protein
VSENLTISMIAQKVKPLKTQGFKFGTQLALMGSVPTEDPERRNRAPGWGTGVVKVAGNTTAHAWTCNPLPDELGSPEFGDDRGVHVSRTEGGIPELASG